MERRRCLVIDGLDIFHGPNAGYVLDLYDRYRHDPQSVDPQTRALFEVLPPVATNGRAQPAVSPGALTPATNVAAIVNAATLAHNMRVRGHLGAHIDPLGTEPRGDPDLDLAANGLRPEDLAGLPAEVVGGPATESARNALEAIEALRRIYSGTTGYDYGHVQVAEERAWLRDAVESCRFHTSLSAEQKRAVLDELTNVEAFERFLHQAFQGQKRFSIEGVDMLVPMLHEIIRNAGATGTREVVMGMAHRGRLNVLAHVLGKPYEQLFAEFREAAVGLGPAPTEGINRGWTGDVRYHLGAVGAMREGDEVCVTLTLASNPSDLAKGFEIPIMHVNADDPAACIAAARLAHAYRTRFRKDVLIDLVGYRRWGHNEGDEPSFTQPVLYQRIDQHPAVRALWAHALDREGLVPLAESDAMLEATIARLREVNRSPAEGLPDEPGASDLQEDDDIPEITTAVPGEALCAYNDALLQWPAGFTPHPRLARLLERRRAALDPDGAIDWGLAETLAFAAILADGTPIRLTGQDTERGTFSQRHLVLHDVKSGQTYTPLQALPQARASFAVYNSPLSENGVLGFEYGYNVHAPETLVLWEAQFGDFANAAQVMIDQFIVGARAKWRQYPSLVLLLPHGYEGQGPEHSNARPERFLQLAAYENLRIANLTTAAQFFHLLRRHAALLEQAPRPLVLLTPKRLLRHPRAAAR